MNGCSLNDGFIVKIKKQTVLIFGLLIGVGILGRVFNFEPSLGWYIGFLIFCLLYLEHTLNSKISRLETKIETLEERLEDME